MWTGIHLPTPSLPFPSLCLPTLPDSWKQNRHLPFLFLLPDLPHLLPSVAVWVLTPPTTPHSLASALYPPTMPACNIPTAFLVNRFLLPAWEDRDRFWTSLQPFPPGLDRQDRHGLGITFLLPFSLVSRLEEEEEEEETSCTAGWRLGQAQKAQNRLSPISFSMPFARHHSVVMGDVRANMCVIIQTS